MSTNPGDNYIMNKKGDLGVEIAHIYALMVKLKLELPVGNMPLTNDKKVPIIAQIKEIYTETQKFLVRHYDSRNSNIDTSTIESFKNIIQVLKDIRVIFKYTPNNNSSINIDAIKKQLKNLITRLSDNLTDFAGLNPVKAPPPSAAAPAPAPALPPPAPAPAPSPPRTIVAPPRAIVAPPPLPARITPTFIHNNPAPDITTPSDTFVEGQATGLGCGRHALNNLLGGVNFIKEYSPSGDITDISELPQKPVALQTICRYFHTKITGKVRPGDCPDNENYDKSVLEAGMRLFGYTSRDVGVYLLNPVTPRSRKSYNEIMNDINSLEKKDLIGFAVHFPGHWTTIRKLENGQFIYIDSLQRDDILTDTLENIIKHPRLANADYIIPYYKTVTTTDYTISYSKQLLQPGRIFKITDDLDAINAINAIYQLPEGYILMKIPDTENNEGRVEYAVVSEEIAPEFSGSSASAAAGTPPPAPPPKTPFYYYDNDIIKRTKINPDGTSVYHILGPDNRWGAEITRELPATLEPIVCPTVGGRRKRIRRTVRAKPKTRPTRRLRKRM